MSKRAKRRLEGWVYYLSYLAFTVGAVALLSGNMIQRFAEALCKLMP